MNKPLRAAQTFGPPPVRRKNATAKNRCPDRRKAARWTSKQVMQILPHRYPFLMVDRSAED